MKLNETIPGAKNFRWYEAVRSETAVRHGIANIPNSDQVASLEYSAQQILQPVRDQFGKIRVTSGFCCEDLAPFIPRRSSSNHCRGEAFDIEPVDRNVELFDIGIWIYENLKFRELIFEFLPFGWIHAAARKGANVQKVKIKDRNHDYDVVSIDYVKRYFNIG